MGPQCTYCKGYFHLTDKCWVNPLASNLKGVEFAKDFWTKTGRTPHPATVAATGGSAPATTAVSTPGVIAGIIAVAAIKNGALVQSMPTPRIKAVKTGTEDIVTLLPA